MAARAPLPTAFARAALALILLASPATAVLSIYPSERDDGLASAAIRVSGSRIVNVYFNNGTTAPTGAACLPGGNVSDEICQWAVQLATTGDLVIVDVAWGNDTIEDNEPTTPSQSRVGTGGDAVNGELGARKVATVALTGTYGELRLLTPAGAGFLDDDGNVLQVAPGGVLLAAGAQMPWSDVSSGANRSCGTPGNGEIQCWGLAGGGTPPGAKAFREGAGRDALGRPLHLNKALPCWGAAPAL